MCPSEVSDVEREIWQRYAAQGVVVFGIASDDTRDAALRFKNQMGLTFPVLFDEQGMVQARYGQLRHDFATVYPQDWIVGVNGTVQYVNAGYEPDEMSAVIEAELLK